MIRRFATKPAVWLIISAVSTIASIVGSAQSNDWVWFQRSGSILTFAGAVLVGRAMVRLGRDGAKPGAVFEKVTVTSTRWDPKQGVVAKFQRSKEAIAQEREEAIDALAAVVGFVMSLLGTMIWGYGDLVGLLFK